MEKKLTSLIYYAFTALFLITPLLMFHKTSELFEFNKMLFIYTATITIGSLWLVKSIISGKLTIAKTPFEIPLALFFGALSLSTIFSIDYHTSVFGYYGRFNGGLLSIATYIFLFYAFLSTIEKEKVISLVEVLLVSCLFTILWGLPGVLGYDLTCLLFTHQLSTSCWTAQFDPTVRLFSTLGQPNWFGAYLAVHFFLGLYFFIHSKKKTRSYFLWAIFEVLVFSALLLTRSRSALFALGIGVGLFILALSHSGESANSADDSRILLRRLWISLLILLIPLFILKTGVPKIDTVLSGKVFEKKTQHIATSSAAPVGVTESFDIRKVVWKGGIALGKKYPLFGSGVETFAYAYFQTRPKEHNLTSEWDFLYNKAHNEYINYFATTGIFGLTTYLIVIGAFLFWILQKIRKKTEHRLFLIVCASSYVTILITNFFGFSTTTINLFFFLLPAMAIGYLGNLRSFQWKIKPIRGILVLPLVIFFGGLFYILSYFFADINYAIGEGYQSISQYETAQSYFENALKLRDEHVYRDKLSQVLATRSYLEGNAKYIEASGQHIQKALSGSPQNPLYFRTSAKNSYLFFQETGKENYFKDAISSIKKAQKLAPTDPRLFYMEALFYASKEKPTASDFKRAHEKLNEAITLKPNYRDAYFLKATLYKKEKNNVEAKKTLQFILSNVQPGDEEANKELENIK